MFVQMLDMGLLVKYDEQSGFIGGAQNETQGRQGCQPVISFKNLFTSLATFLSPHLYSK